ncbi:SDR family NAD(P)-dependent oxidoreductase [bacterium]|nr:SDR family NAD(P)-dependent oxidoreductase [bacterium]
MKLTGNTILVTGGSRGIGFAIAKRFLESGNTVIITGRSESHLEAATQKLPGVQSVCCDLRQADEIERLFTEVTKRWPALNILVNNAGVQFNYQFTEEPLPFTRVDDEVAVNLLAPIRLSALFLSTLSVQDEAAIINLTSALALAPKQNAAVYCATKSALQSFTQSLRYQVEGSPLRIVELMPPLVDTDMTAGRCTGKVTPSEVAEALMKGLERGATEILVGKTRILKTLIRILPSLVQSKMRVS